MRVETGSEQLLFSTLRLQTPTGVGTAFIVTHEWLEGKEGLFLVTNKHVVDTDSSCEITFTLRKGDGSEDVPQLGAQHTVNISGGAWRWTYHPSHEVDVAVLALSPITNYLSQNGIRIFFRSVPTTLIPDEDALTSFDVVEDIIFVGYPSGMFDEANNLPIFRKGIVATHPSIDYNRKPITLIDASVFPGSSGSPVFLHRVGPWREDNDRLRRAERFHLLGVLGEVFLRKEDGLFSFEEIPAAVRAVVKTQQMIDLGVVYKGKCVVEAIDLLLRDRGELP